MGIKFNPSTSVQNVSKIFYNDQNGTHRVGKICGLNATTELPFTGYLLQYPISLSSSPAPHCTLSGASYISFGESSVSCTLTADSGYTLPANIQVTNAYNNYSPASGDTTTSFTIWSPEAGADAITITAVASVVTYSVTSNLTGVTASGMPSTIASVGDPQTFTVSASSGYVLPDTITVNGVSGTRGTTGITWSYSKTSTTSGTVTLQSPSTDVSITIAGAVLYTVSPTVTNGTSSPTSVQLKSGDTSTTTFTITANSGYHMPTSITVNGTTGSSGSGWSFTTSADLSTGYLIFSGFIMSAAPTISIACIASSYTITPSVTHGSSSPSSISVSTGDDPSFTLTSDTANTYALPSTITVDGTTGTSGSSGNVSSWTYTRSTTNSTTGTLSLTDVTGAPTIVVTCASGYGIEAIVTNGISVSGNPTVIGPGTDGATATLYFDFDGTTYKCPDAVTVTNATGSWNKIDNQQGRLTLSGATGSVAVRVVGERVVTSYTVAPSITNGFISPTSTTVTSGGSATFTLTSNTANTYALPSSITVDGTTGTSGSSGNIASWTYTRPETDSTTGTLSVIGVTGTPSISISCMSGYTILATTVNATAEGDNPTVIGPGTDGAKAYLRFSFDGTTYKCPSSVTVTNATGSWNPVDVTDGRLTLSNATGNVVVKVRGTAV